jgi:hypothetical protein
MTFKRPHHQRIALILKALDADLLKAHQCYFGGGTAIAMRHGEYRESVDIDFMVSDLSCYRELRSIIRSANSINPLLNTNLENMFVHTDIRQDQYGIRTRIGIADILVKFEIILEGRISFSEPAISDQILGIFALSDIDLAASKLLANSDRGLDTSAHFRDIIDLSMLTLKNIELRIAIEKAVSAYGSSVLGDIDKVVQLLAGKQGLLASCLHTMGIETPVAVVWQKIKQLQKRLR